MASNTGKMDIARKRVVTPIARLAFPAIFEPKAFEGQDPQYQVILIFPGNIDLKKVAPDSSISLWDAYLAAMEEKFGPDQKKWPANHRKPFRPGEEKGSFEGFTGNIFLTAKSDDPPGAINSDMSAIMDAKELYAGCYVRCELIAWGYDVGSNKGVSFTLMNIQKVKDAKAFSGRKDAASVFSAIQPPEDLAIGEDDTSDESRDAGAGDDEADSMFS